MLSDWLKLSKIKDFISKVRIGGFTADSMINENNQNTRAALKKLARRSILGEVPAETFMQQLGKTIKIRKRQTLNNLRNIMSGVRGQARSIQAFGRQGQWFNVGTFDSAQTAICSSYMGRSWDMSYSQIPSIDKPPRIAEQFHYCRSYLEFVEKGQEPINQAPFMDQFNSSDEVKLDMLGKTRYEALKAGELEIKSFKDYEKSVLNTLDDLGL